MKVVLGLLAVALALVTGCGSDRGAEKLSKSETDALRFGSYSEFLQAAAGASLVKLADVNGDSPAQEDLDDSYKGPGAIDDILAIVEDEKADTEIDLGDDEPVTVKAFLAEIANTAEKYWPEEVSRIDRVRESLP